MEIEKKLLGTALLLIFNRVSATLGAHEKNTKNILDDATLLIPGI